MHRGKPADLSTDSWSWWSLWCLNRCQQCQGLEKEPGALHCKKWHVLLAVSVEWQRSSPASAAAASPLPSCLHPSQRAGRQTPCRPCRFNAKWLFFPDQEPPGGTQRLMGCVKGAPVRSAQSHLSEPGGGKGESYCTNSHSRLIAFHLSNRNWPFSPGIQ